MAIVRWWDPLRDLSSIQEKMNQLFEDTLSRTRGREEGFGSGMWSRAGNEWTEEVEFRNRGASDGSARNIWKFTDDGHFEWRAVDREVDGQPVADAAVKFVRKAPK